MRSTQQALRMNVAQLGIRVKTLEADKVELVEALKGLRDWCDQNLNGAPAEYAKLMEAADSAIVKHGALKC